MILVKYVRDNIGHQHIVTTLCRQERTMKTDNVKVNLTSERPQKPTNPKVTF